MSPPKTLQRYQLDQPGLFSEATDDQVDVIRHIVLDYVSCADRINKDNSNLKVMIVKIINIYLAKKKYSEAVSDATLKSKTKSIYKYLDHISCLIKGTDAYLLNALNREVSFAKMEHNSTIDRASDFLKLADDLRDAAISISNKELPAGRKKNVAVYSACYPAIDLYESLHGRAFPRSAKLSKGHLIEKHAFFIYKIISSLDKGVTESHVSSALKNKFRTDIKGQ